MTLPLRTAASTQCQAVNDVTMSAEAGGAPLESLLPPPAEHE